VVAVYWNDNEEPIAPFRGTKHDAVACANVLHSVAQAGLMHSTGQPRQVVDATFAYVLGHLTSHEYRQGTRYYPLPEMFLFAASRLCHSGVSETPQLATSLNAALADLVRDAEIPATALALALRICAANNLGYTPGQDQWRTALLEAQLPNGSWPAGPLFSLGRMRLYFGSPYLTTVFAVSALNHCHDRT
jgi:hypothetical protein